jgi:CheY-like chemotaxis protein
MNDSSNGARPAHVLLVEDSEGDVILTQKSFARATPAVDLAHVENGEECMKYLRQQGKYAGAQPPDLVLLDINMPVMDGREVLAEMQKDAALRQVAVVVLTTSSAARDVTEMYQLGCNSYITKPVDYTQFQKIIQNLATYWFTTVALPTGR